jgi:hypothetical protein
MVDRRREKNRQQAVFLPFNQQMQSSAGSWSDPATPSSYTAVRISGVRILLVRK